MRLFDLEKAPLENLDVPLARLSIQIHPNAHPLSDCFRFLTAEILSADLKA
jgi:hypothetical protein